MSCSRKSLVLSACAALLCSAPAQEKPDEAGKKARAEFLKRQEAQRAAAPKAAATPPKTAAKPGKAAPSRPAAAPAPPPPTPMPLRLTVAPTPAPKEVPRINLVVPKGQDSIGVTIPMYDGGTRKTMNFQIGVATRIDDDRVKMKNLVIDTFDEEGALEMTVTLPGAVLDLNTRVITGDETCTVQRADFELTGQSIQFNTVARQGWIKGNVKMTIHDLSDDDAAAAEPAPKPKS
jgi:hypothetical protein